MRILIDIPKGEYDKICKTMLHTSSGNPNFYFESKIANGTPIPDNATNVLDAIKLEIKQEYDKQGDWSFNDGLVFALEIIDKHIKAQTE